MKTILILLSILIFSMPCLADMKQCTICEKELYDFNSSFYLNFDNMIAPSPQPLKLQYEIEVCSDCWEKYHIEFNQIMKKWLSDKREENAEKRRINIKEQREQKLKYLLEEIEQLKQLEPEIKSLRVY